MHVDDEERLALFRDRIYPLHSASGHVCHAVRLNCRCPFLPARLLRVEDARMQESRHCKVQLGVPSMVFPLRFCIFPIEAYFYEADVVPVQRLQLLLDPPLMSLGESQLLTANYRHPEV